MKQHILYGKAGFKFKSKNTNSWLRPSNEMTEWSRCSLVCLFSIECNEYPTLQKWFFLTSWKPSISVTIHSDFGRINYVVRKSIFDHNYKNTSQPCLVNWQWIPWRIGVFKGDHLVSWCVRRFCHYDQAMVFQCHSYSFLKINGWNDLVLDVFQRGLTKHFHAFSITVQ